MHIVLACLFNELDEPKSEQGDKQDETQEEAVELEEMLVSDMVDQLIYVSSSGVDADLENAKVF